MPMGIQELLSEMEARDEGTAAMIFKRFGDEQSTLLDQYERLSFEVHLNKAMELARSLSESAASRCLTPTPTPTPTPQPPCKPVRRGLRSSFRKVMKRLLSPILGRKDPGGKDGGSRPPPVSWNKFSRSVRV